MAKKKYRCLVLVARKHGLEALMTLLRLKDDFELVAIFTHRLNPKSLDPERKQRMDFEEFLKVAIRNNIPLHSIDSVQENIELEKLVKRYSFDFLISVSWRYLIIPSVYRRARIAALNMHRGNLPNYAGAEPIKRALENGDSEIAITAHYLNEKFDDGEIISKIFHPTNYDNSKSLHQNVDRLKDEITPLFSQLLLMSIYKVLGQKH